MTTEEKAKAYDEALKWMRELYPGLHGATKEDAEHYFPELRESEDERIRRTLVEYFGRYNPKDKWDDEFSFKDVLDYLEKQKEQKHDGKKWIYEDDYDKDMERTFNDGKDEVLENPEKYGLCKKAKWSEEDAKKIQFLEGLIRYQVEDGEYYCIYKDCSISKEEAIEMLKSLRTQPHWKPSKEQMGALNYAYCELFKREDVVNNILGSLQKLLDDLKKLM